MLVFHFIYFISFIKVFHLSQTNSFTNYFCDFSYWNITGIYLQVALLIGTNSMV